MQKVTKTTFSNCLTITRKAILSSFLLFTFFSITVKASVDVTATIGNPSASYANLSSAFSQINAGIHQGDITILVTSDIVETSTAMLTYSGAASGATYTSIHIYPSGGLFTISGAITAGSPLIDLNGADSVTIDGFNNGTNNLTFTNTTVSATAGTSTIRFINGAVNNVVTNCTISGSCTSAVTVAGGNILFSTDSNTPNGNDNNAISYCLIGPAGSNLPTKGISSIGSATNIALANSGNTFTYNSIFNYFGAAVTSSGIYMGTGNTDNTVSYSHFYQTATRTQTSNSQHSAVWINSSAGNNFMVRSNRIGYANEAGTGIYSIVQVLGSSFVPVYISAGNIVLSKINADTIAGISISGAGAGTSISGPFRGIHVASGLAATDSNFIGSQTSMASISYTSSSTSTSEITAIYSFASQNAEVISNTIGGMNVTGTGSGAANLYGIWCNNTSTFVSTIVNNVIGGSLTNSMLSGSTATGSRVTGIQVQTSATDLHNNTIRNLTASAGSGTTINASVMGICVSSTATSHAVYRNVITSLGNTNPIVATVVSGIQYSGSSSGTKSVWGNFIHSLSCASNSGTINGINISSGTTTYYNNMIALGYNDAGSSITTGCSINGINEPAGAGTNNLYFNSIYIGGSGVGNSGNTYAFNSLVVTNTRNYRNNIFYNARSNGTGTGKHYAIQVGGSSANPAGLTLNYNDYLSNGTGGYFGRFGSNDYTSIATWRLQVGQDINSQNEDPQFLNPTGSAAAVNLHISPTQPTPIEGTGTDIPAILMDYDLETRAGLTPVDIGADAVNAVAIILPVINSVAKNPDANQCIATDRTITANITAGSYDLSSVVLKYKYNSGTTTSVTMTGGNIAAGTTSDWTGIIPTASPLNATVTWSVTVTAGATTKTTNGSSYADAPIPELVVTTEPNPVCAGDTATFTVGLVPPDAPAASSYCASTHVLGCFNDNISRVVLNTLDNNTGSSCGGSSHYTYFVGVGSKTTTLMANQTYMLQVTMGFDPNQFVGAWIDFNHDGTYTTDEFLSTSLNAGANGTALIPVPVLKSAYNGLTHLRIVGGNESPLAASDACGPGSGSGSFGETQDYDITITNGTDMIPLSAGMTAMWLVNAVPVGYVNPWGLHPFSTTTYTVTVSDANSCTKSKDFNEVVLPVSYAEIRDTACGSYTLNDSIYTASGTYVQHRTNSIGCDSVITLYLIIADSSSTVFYDTACNIYTLNDSIYTATGTYTQHLINAAGCDSLLTLHLTILENVTTISPATAICEGACATLTATSTLPNSIITWSNGLTGNSITVCPTVTTKYAAHSGGGYGGLNMIVNGDFGNGNTGFTTDYTYQYPNNPGNYWIEPGQPFTDHTPTADNLFMLVDGGINPNAAFWRQQVSGLQPNTNYRFSFFTTRVDIAPQKIQVLFNGTQQTVYTALPIGGGGWAGVFDEVAFVWNSGNSTATTIELKDLETQGNGNDFLIDDISLQKENCAVTDSVLVTVKHHTSHTITDTICGHYLLNDSVYSVSGDYTQHLINTDGCDSIITLHLLVVPATYSTIDTTACDSIVYGGNTYFSSITDSLRYKTVNDCDSIVILHVTIKHSSRTIVDTTACDSLVYGGETYFSSTSDSAKYTNASGCDSMVVLHVNINHSSRTIVDTTACDSLVYGGHTYFSSTSDSAKYTNASGCDSMVVLHVTIKHSSTKVIDTTVCKSFTLNNQHFTSSGTYTQHRPNAAGCDSTIILHLTIYHDIRIVIDTTVCDSLLYGGRIYFISGADSFHYTSNTGCDSNVIIHYTIYHSYRSVINDTVCSNALPYRWGTAQYSQSGTYTQRLHTVKGCDSLLIVNLTVIPNPQVVITGDAAVCRDSCTTLTAVGAANATYMWYPGGETTHSIKVCPTLKTTYTVTVGTTSAANLITNGDFSNGYVGFTAHPTLYQIFGSTSPGHYAVTNNPMLVAGYFRIVNDHTPNADNKMLVVDASTDVTKPYFWKQLGIAVQPYTHYRFTFWYALGLLPNPTIRMLIANGSGSPVIAYKDVRSSGITSGVWQQYFADFTTPNTGNISISLASQNIDASGNDFAVDDIELHRLHCTSSASATVSIKYPSSKTISTKACDSYTLNNVNYTASGTYVQHLTNAVGCDSAITLKLIINYSVTTHIYDSTCSFPYKWNSVLYNAPGTYTQAFKTILGCDSIVILHLSAYTNIINTTGNATICAGDCVTLSASGYPANTIYKWLPTGGATNSTTVCPLVSTTYRLAATYAGTNLITNGDFTSGTNSGGFATQYMQSFSTATAAVGTYSIINISKMVNTTWTNIADHTSTADNNMLLVDGDTKKPARYFWQMNVPVVQGRLYRFVYWCAMVNSTNAPVIFGNISTPNSTSNIVLANFSPLLNVSNPQGTWQRFSRDFIASGTSIIITLRDSSFAPDGNDFAIDDISLQQVFCNDTTTYTVTVNPKPKGVISGSLTIPCTAQSTVLTASSSAGTPSFTYKWYGGTPPFSTTATSGSTFAAQAGIWSLVVTDAKGCKDTTTVTVRRDPCCDYILQYVVNPCGNGIKFSIAGGTATALNWKLDGNTVTGTGNPQMITAATGTHIVCATFVIISNGKKDTCTKCITVYFPPDTFCTFTTDFCFTSSFDPKGQRYSFTNATSVPTGVTQTYEWDFGDPASGTANTSKVANPVHIYTTPGTYTVCLTVIRTCEGRVCRIRCCKTIYANGHCNMTPTTDFQYVINYGALYTTIRFTATGAPTGSYFLWKINGTAASSAATFDFTPTAPGTYVVCLLDSVSPDCKKLICHNVIVDQKCILSADFLAQWCKSTPLKVDFTSSMAFVNMGQTFQWNFGDGTTSTSAAPSHTYTAAGIYTVCLTITLSPLCNSTSCYRVDVGTAICPVVVTKSVVTDEPQQSTMTKANGDSAATLRNEVRRVTLYPNPTASQTFIVKTSYSLKNATIQLMDVNGKTQPIQVKIRDENSKEVRLQNATPGFYFVEILADGKRDVGKIEVL